MAATATATAQPTTGQLWFRSLRAPFLTASVFPAVLGLVLAYQATGAFDPLLGVLTFAGVVLFHLATNTLNDAFDFRSGNDLAVKHQNPFAGGSRVLLTGRISVRAHLAMALSFFVGGVVIGLVLFVLVGGFGTAAGIGVLVIGVLGAGAVLFYVGPPLRFAHRGVGELLTGLGFGPLVVIGAFVVQTGTWNPGVVLLSVSMGLLVCAILWINEFPDIPADTSVGKRTLVARMGPVRALAVYEEMIATAFVLPVLAVVLRFLFPAVAMGVPPVTAVLPLLAAPLAVKAIRHARANYRDPMALIPANAGTIGLTMVFGVLLILGVIPGFWIEI